MLGFVVVGGQDEENNLIHLSHSERIIVDHFGKIYVADRQHLKKMESVLVKTNKDTG
jgi:hypothetical protein